MSDFTLNINADNAATRDPHEIAELLREVAKDVVALASEAPGGTESSGDVRDLNGNTVGSWTYHPPTYTHRVTLEVVMLMEEMDSPSSEASAEIAMGLVHDTLTEHVGDIEDVTVTEHEVVE